MSYLTGTTYPTEGGGIRLYFTSLSFSGAFWEQNWHSLGLRKTVDFGSCGGTCQHFFICGKSKSSRDLLLFGSCNLFLSCWEESWNWGCYLKCLLHRVQLCSQSVTISCPLQMLMYGWNSLTDMYLSVAFLFTVTSILFYFIYANTKFVGRQQGAGKFCRHCLYARGLGSKTHFCISVFNFLSSFWEIWSGWLWCQGAHGISSD